MESSRYESKRRCNEHNQPHGSKLTRNGSKLTRNGSNARRYENKKPCYPIMEQQGQSIRFSLKSNFINGFTTELFNNCNISLTVFRNHRGVKFQHANGCSVLEYRSRVTEHHYLKCEWHLLRTATRDRFD